MQAECDPCRDNSSKHSQITSSIQSQAPAEFVSTRTYPGLADNRRMTLKSLEYSASLHRSEKSHPVHRSHAHQTETNPQLILLPLIKLQSCTDLRPKMRQYPSAMIQAKVMTALHCRRLAGLAERCDQPPDRRMHRAMSREASDIISYGRYTVPKRHAKLFALTSNVRLLLLLSSTSRQMPTSPLASSHKLFLSEITTNWNVELAFILKLSRVGQ